MATTIQASIIANGQYIGSQPGPSYEYILTNYPNASMAYSLRKLNVSYTGPAIKVRRDSDDEEADIYFIDGQGLDINSLLSFVGPANGYVSIWYDQSGNSRNLYQDLFSRQPLIVNSEIIEILGNRPAIYFDGDFKSFQIAITPYTFNAQTVSFTAKNDFGQGNIVNLSTLDSELESVRAQIKTIDNLFMVPIIPYTYQSTETSQDETSLTYPDGSFFFNGSSLSESNSVENYHLGFVNVSSDYSSSAFNSLSLALGRGIFWQGYIQEYIIWETNYSAARPSIETNINNYYNIY